MHLSWGEPSLLCLLLPVLSSYHPENARVRNKKHHWIKSEGETWIWWTQIIWNFISERNCDYIMQAEEQFFFLPICSIFFKYIISTASKGLLLASPKKQRWVANYRWFSSGQSHSGTFPKKEVQVGWSRERGLTMATDSNCGWPPWLSS